MTEYNLLHVATYPDVLPVAALSYLFAGVFLEDKQRNIGSGVDSAYGATAQTWINFHCSRRDRPRAGTAM